MFRENWFVVVGTVLVLAAALIGVFSVREHLLSDYSRECNAARGHIAVVGTNGVLCLTPDGRVIERW